MHAIDCIAWARAELNADFYLCLYLFYTDCQYLSQSFYDYMYTQTHMFLICICELGLMPLFSKIKVWVHSLHRTVVIMRVVLVWFALCRFRVVKWKCFMACSPAFTSCMQMFAMASCSTSWRPTACFVRMMIWFVIFNSNFVEDFESLWRVFLSWHLFSLILLNILQMKNTCQLYHVSC